MYEQNFVKKRVKELENWIFKIRNFPLFDNFDYLLYRIFRKDTGKQVLLISRDAVILKVPYKAIRQDKLLTRQERQRRIVELKKAEGEKLAAERQVRTDLQQFLALGTNTAVKRTQERRSRWVRSSKRSMLVPVYSEV